MIYDVTKPLLSMLQTIAFDATNHCSVCYKALICMT